MEAEDVPFDGLSDARDALRDACRPHAASVLAFLNPDHAWFVITLQETPRHEPVSHLSTSASCLASLWDLPIRFRPKTLTALSADFSARALQRRDWASEGAARTYCRVRTLPFVLEHAPAELLDEHAERIAELIGQAWAGVSVTPPNQAIAEHGIFEKGAPRRRATDKEDSAYPPNAFLTFWGLRLRDLVDRHHVIKARLPDDLEAQAATALLWCERTLAAQVALSDVKSDRFDPHQLAWSIAAVAEFSDETSLRRPATVALLRAGLAAFFNAQDRDSANWARGDPLFHYPTAGNAYCYTFETLMELVRPALRASRGGIMRSLLRPHASNLLAAWKLAEATREPLPTERGVGWSSNNHPHRVQPEAWATAAVFSFHQLLRSLVGSWTRDIAARQLGVVSAGWVSPQDGVTKLTERGDTWRVRGWTAGERLAGLFVHPVIATARPAHWVDPDVPLIEDGQARSAILFGPPGTSKTTLVKSLAAAISWDYAEVHSSHFLSEGMDKVPSRADAIFGLLMELDHCVVLFDEIDELIRDRGAGDSDPFGRFLTTSMLPKLTRLWEQRRVLFFVNMNWIDKADAAIKRSQRFDAAIFVAPPGFDKKAREVRDLLAPEANDKLDADVVSAALEDARRNDPLAWLALLRYDQIGELKQRLRNNAPAPGHLADMDELKEVLGSMAGALANADWNPGDIEKDDKRSPNERALDRYRSMVEEDRVDSNDVCLARLDQPVGADLPEGYTAEAVIARETETYLGVSSATPPPSSFKARDWTAEPSGLLTYRVLRRPDTRA